MAKEIIDVEPEGQLPVVHGSDVLPAGGMTALPPDRLKEHLAAVAQKREIFVADLRAKMEPGVHYGWPPGCEPKLDEKGWIIQTTKKGEQHIPPWQWQQKPALYKRGADLLADYFGVHVENIRVERSTLPSPWKNETAERQTFMVTIDLVQTATGRVVSSGIGSAFVGEKGWDGHQALSQATKRAQTNATLRLPLVNELYEDEEFVRAAREGAEVKDDAPIQPTRTERNPVFDTPAFLELKAAYKKKHPDASASDFSLWAAASGRPELREGANWTDKDVSGLLDVLNGGDK